MVKKPRRPSIRARNDAYMSRLLAATALVVALAGVVVNLPFKAVGASRVGWQVLRTDQVIALENVRFEEGFSQLPGVIISDHPPVPSTDELAEKPGSGDDGESEDESGAEVEAAGQERVARVQRLVLAAAETMPEIEGGLGAYYINIIYPQEAAEYLPMPGYERPNGPSESTSPRTADFHLLSASSFARVSSNLARVPSSPVSRRPTSSCQARPPGVRQCNSTSIR